MAQSWRIFHLGSSAPEDTLNLVETELEISRSLAECRQVSCELSSRVSNWNSRTAPPLESRETMRRDFAGNVKNRLVRNSGRCRFPSVQSGIDQIGTIEVRVVAVNSSIKSAYLKRIYFGNLFDLFWKQRVGV